MLVVVLLLVGLVVLSVAGDGTFDKAAAGPVDSFFGSL